MSESFRFWLLFFLTLNGNGWLSVISGNLVSDFNKFT